MRQKAEKYADVYRAVSCVDKPWSERKQSTPGYMTVYLALVMGILLSLILAVLTAEVICTSLNWYVYRVLCGYGVGFCAGGISSGNVGSV